LKSQPLAAQAAWRDGRRRESRSTRHWLRRSPLTLVEPVYDGIDPDAFAIVWRAGEYHDESSGQITRGVDDEYFQGRPVTATGLEIGNGAGAVVGVGGGFTPVRQTSSHDLRRAGDRTAAKDSSSHR